MKKIIRCSLLILGIMLNACSQDENPTTQSANKALSISSVNVAGHMTRSATTITAGSMGIFLGANSLYEARNNVKYTYANGAWGSDSPILLSAATAVVCAYYPYKSTITNATNILLASQPYTPDEDLCYANSTGKLNNESASWNLTLQRAYSMITLNITKNASYTGTGAISQISISNAGLPKSGTLNILTGAYSGIQTGNLTYNPQITAIASGESASASVLIVPAATAMSDFLTIRITVDGVSRYADLSMASNGLDKPAPGYQYIINAEIQNISTRAASIALTGIQKIAIR